MAKRKDRALLHSADRRLRRKLLAIGAAAGLLALILIVTGLVSWIPQKGLGFEIYKLCLQFLLITAVGGVLLAMVGNFRDEAARRQTRAMAIQQLDRELDRVYRSSKRTRRQLRTQLSQSAGTEPGPDAAGSARHGPRLERAVFDKTMDEFLTAQLELETICDHISQRDDILGETQLRRLREPLRYASRYLHDVYEDFQRGRVRLSGDHYLIDDAPTLKDFLCGSKRTERPAAVAAWLVRLKGQGVGAPPKGACRFARGAAALHAIVKLRLKTNDARYADVANACFDLLSAELAETRRRLLR